MWAEKIVRACQWCARATPPAAAGPAAPQLQHPAAPAHLVPSDGAILRLARAGRVADLSSADDRLLYALLRLLHAGGPLVGRPSSRRLLLLLRLLICGMW